MAPMKIQRLLGVSAFCLGIFLVLPESSPLRAESTAVEEKTEVLREKLRGILAGIDAIQNDPSLTQEQKDARSAPLQAQAQDLEARIKYRDGRQTNRDKRAVKKDQKIQKNEEKIQELETERNELLREAGLSAGTASEAETAKLQRRIQEKTAKINRLKNSNVRKDERYEELTGEKRTVSAPSVAPPPGDVSGTGVATQKPKQAVPLDSRMKDWPECWKTSEKPIEEVVPAVFGLGQTSVTEEQAQRFEQQLKDLWPKLEERLQTEGLSKISRIEAVPSASSVPSLRLTNDELAIVRAESGLSAFDGGLLLTGIREKAAAPNYERRTDYAQPKVRGPQWNEADRALRGKKPVTDEDLRARAEQLAEDTDTPVKTVEELKECCATDQFSLKYGPYQYVKIEIYGGKLDPTLPECQAMFGGRGAVSTADETVKSATVGLPAAVGAPTVGSPVKTSGELHSP